MTGAEIESALRDIRRGLDVSGLEYGEAKELQEAVDEHREETEGYVPFTRVAPDRSSEGSTWKVTQAAHGRTFR